MQQTYCTSSSLVQHRTSNPFTQIHITDYQLLLVTSPSCITGPARQCQCLNAVTLIQHYTISTLRSQHSSTHTQTDLPALLMKPASASGASQTSQRKQFGCQLQFIALMTRPMMNSSDNNIHQRSHLPSSLSHTYRLCSEKYTHSHCLLLYLPE